MFRYAPLFLDREKGASMQSWLHDMRPAWDYPCPPQRNAGGKDDNLFPNGISDPPSGKIKLRDAMEIRTEFGWT